MAQLNFTARQLEADFRYSVIRIRDNAESIAFYGGEKMELNDVCSSGFCSFFYSLFFLLLFFWFTTDFTINF